MIGATSGALTGVSSPILAIGLYKGESVPQELEGTTATKVLSNGDFSGKEGETALIYTPDGMATPRLLLVGLGERTSFTLEKLRRASATVAKRARKLKLKEATFGLPMPEGAGVREAAEAAAEGGSLGLYRFDHYKTNAEGGDPSGPRPRQRALEHGDPGVPGRKGVRDSRTVRYGGDHPRPS